MSYSLGSAQRAFDNRQSADDWQPEPQTSKDCEAAIDLLKSAQRLFCGPDSFNAEAMDTVEAAILKLLRNPEIRDGVTGVAELDAQGQPA